jgi:hypothetical protein
MDFVPFRFAKVANKFPKSLIVSKNFQYFSDGPMDMVTNRRMQESEICIHTGDAGGT